MTAVWGPLGWMTLHSVATCYPENPVQTEKELMYSWLDMFRDTITCPHCQQHFSNMLATYRSSFPNMLSSRQEFVLFTFRAHNAVNRRLKKPMYSTVEECMDTLKNNVKNRSAKDYRISYINHITRHWKTFQDVTGIVAMKKIAEMKKIDIEYIQARDTNFEVNITPDVVVLPRDALDKDVEPQRQGPSIFNLGKRNGPAVGIRITSGGIRLRR
jgi:hypothetical protein